MLHSDPSPTLTRSTLEPSPYRGNDVTDVWNPDFNSELPMYNGSWMYEGYNVESPGTPEPSQESPVSSSSRQVNSQLSHWLSQPVLCDIPIIMDITMGEFKGKNVYVKPTLLGDGSVVARLKQKKTVRDVLLDLVERAMKRVKVNENQLLVVIDIRNPHFRKCV
ncbi:hypothetical protein E1B28_006814 [Marasmius oreades]|uniref:Uncharacterized protein n=1 Tax=Marasmius oreades TaxID=181124 RepID=A0A9P7UWU3_9AGAR|nr:uncharacterized protein E1B28_006814 [Marasmius oreades]KAG7096141.1 hypothetical protein E1B28_006814 [Marasmius oreades]